MANIGDLVATLKLNAREFQNEMKRASNSGKSFATSFIKYGAVAATAVSGALVLAFTKVVNIVNETTEQVSAMWDQFNSIGGGSFASFQGLAYAAKQSGTSIGNVTKAVAKMQRFLSSDKSAGVLEKLGLSQQKVMAMSPENQFIAIAQAIAKIKDSAERTDTATSIFGKGAISNMALMRENIKALQQEFVSLGGALTNEQAKNIEAFGDTVGKLSATFDALKLQLTSLLTGPGQKLLDWIQDYIKQSGGIGEVAKQIAVATIGAARGMVAAWGIVKQSVDSVYYLMLKLNLIMLGFKGSGWAKIADPTGQIRNQVKDEIAAVQVRIADRKAGYDSIDAKLTALQNELSAKNVQQVTVQNFDQLGNQVQRLQKPAEVQVQVNVQADDGLTAKVVNSSSNKDMIIKTTGDLIKQQTQQWR